MKTTTLPIFVFFFCIASVIQAQVLNVSIISSQNATCNGLCNGTANAQASGGTGNYSYSWSNGSVNANQTNLCAGTYSVIVSDGLTQDTATTVITQPPPIAINLNSPISVCAGASVSICPTVTGGSGAFTFSWAPFTGLNSVTTACPTFIGNTNTTYTINVTDANGCVATASTSVIVNTVNATANNSGPYCAGNTVQLSVNGGVNYLWVGPNGFTSNLQNPIIMNATTAMSGIYTATVTASSGCTTTATTSVTVNNPPTIFPSSNSPICQGSNLLLNCTNSGAISFTWAGPNGFFSALQNPMISNLQLFNSGTYTLTANSNPNCSTTATLSVIVSPAPTLSINSFSPPDCAMNNGIISLTGSGGAAPYLYSGNSCGIGNFGPGTPSTVSNICSGAAAFYLADANGCTDTLNFMIPDSCDLVWPGDANDDLIADNLDFLEIGLGFGAAGTSRFSPGNGWTGQASYTWGTFVNGLTDDKHIDCDGNGIIDLNDTNAVVLNYGFTRPASRITSNNSNISLSNNALLAMNVIQDTIPAGGTGNIQINLGTNSNPVPDFYGICFTLNFDATLINPASFTMNANGSWAGIQNSNLFCVALNDGVSGQVKATITRYDHANSNGFGLLGQMGFQTRVNYSGTQPIYFTLSDVKMIDNANQVSGLQLQNDSAIALNPALVINENNLHQSILYPNPFSSSINLTMGKSSNYELRIMDVSGKQIRQKFFTGNVLQENNLELSSGLYLFQIFENKELISQGKLIRE